MKELNALRQEADLHRRFQASKQTPASILDSLHQRQFDDGEIAAYRFISDTNALDAALIWTWREVYDRAESACQEILRNDTIRSGDRVLLTYSSGLDFIVALLGCFLAGVIAVPVSPPRRNDGHRWSKIYRDAGASASFAGKNVLDQVKTLSRTEGFGPCAILSAADPEQPTSRCLQPADRRQAKPDDIAFLQYTSGSTGAPKGVIVTHAMLQTNLAQIVEGFGYHAGDHLLSWLPMYHDMGLVSSVLLPIHMGIGTTLVAPGMFMRDPMAFLELVGQIGATAIGGPNFAYDHCVRKATPEVVARLNLSSLRVVFSGAEPIRADTVQAFGDTFARCGLNRSALVGCYGMAEATLCVSVSAPGQGPRQTEDLNRAFIESGLAPTGVDLAIVDPPQGTRCPDGRVGEIWVRGDNVAPGYWNQPQASAEVFDQHLDGQNGWMRSGDLGFLQDGHLFVTGRIKDMIIIRGVNHCPQDIEATIGAGIPQVQPGRVAAFELGEGIGLVCEMTRAAYREADPNEVMAAIGSVVTEGHGLVATRITLVRPASLPVTPSGKIQRAACRETLPGMFAQWRAEVGTPTAAQMGTTRTERGRLARELCAVPKPLRRSRLMGYLRDQLAATTGATGEIEDATRFFDLGLESASGVALIAALSHELDLRLEAALIYEHPTPAALCDHLLELLFAPHPVSAPAAQDDFAALRAMLTTPVA